MSTKKSKYGAIKQSDKINNIWKCIEDCMQECIRVFSKNNYICYYFLYILVDTALSVLVIRHASFRNCVYYTNVS